MTVSNFQEVIKPVRYGIPTDQAGFWLYFVLSFVFLALAIVYIAGLKAEVNTTDLVHD